MSKGTLTLTPPSLSLSEENSVGCLASLAEAAPVVRVLINIVLCSIFVSVHWRQIMKSTL